MKWEGEEGCSGTDDDDAPSRSRYLNDFHAAVQRAMAAAR